ncbi:MAG: hypothetical protein ACK4MS_10535 [Paracoccaceae bacterium]
MKLEDKRKGFATRLPIEIHNWLYRQSQKMGSSINSEIVRALQVAMTGQELPPTPSPKNAPPAIAEQPSLTVTANEPQSKPVEYSFGTVAEDATGTDAPIVNPDFAITIDMTVKMERLWRELLVATEVLNRYRSPPKAWLPSVTAKKSYGVSLRSEVTLFGDEVVDGKKQHLGWKQRDLHVTLRKDDILPILMRRHSELLTEMKSAQDDAFARFTDSKAGGRA